jgi:uncharacterized protein YjbJ (UPF0337 family)
MINQDILEGKWKQLRGKVQQRWGKLTNDDLDLIQGKTSELAGRLQERYGYAREKAEQEIDRFLEEMDNPNQM